ncbi:hypothetical protein ONZ45_g13550 [Pleurotus djamor]|nr:hypothetical protein ONZ45_g13550 [Pleurotus djamor]
MYAGATYAVIAVAKAHAEQIEIEAQAQASATKLAAEADAEAIRVKSEADARVRDEFARSMIYKRVEVEKVKAYGPKTVFAPSEAKSTELGNVMALGMAAGMGATSQAAQS